MNENIKKWRRVQDMALQSAAIEAGKEYVEVMFKDVEDTILLARIRQAVGAGYICGFRVGKKTQFVADLVNFGYAVEEVE